MVLAVDIGNSNIVLGCFEDDSIKFVERFSTDRSSTVMEYTVLIKAILELHGLDGCTFEGGIISSVVPSLTNTLSDAVERLTGRRIMAVGPGVKTGLRLAVDNPAALGSDRVTDAVAAVNCYDVPIIIIDMGTATTISVVDKNKNFKGGLIMPGVRISLDSLASGASQLPNIGIEPSGRIIGTNTVDCMKSGMIYGTASKIDGIIDRISDELGKKCNVVATGGLSGTIIPYCKHNIALDPQLLLKGLMLIYKKNQ